MNGWRVLFVLFLLPITTARADRKISRKEIKTTTPLPEGSLLVIGFLGAWEDWDNPNRSVRKLAIRLREMTLPGVYVETADNHSRGTMRKFIRDAFDRNRDRKIDPDEARRAQVILYGQSFGGAAAVYLARELEKSGIPVRLTIQVDSIGRKDDLIPPNVRRAVNFFQNDPGPIQGRAEIRAEDPSRTSILGNFQHFYLFREVNMDDYPWIARKTGLSHWKMDNDPIVWAQVEGYLLAEILRWKGESSLTRRP